MTAMFSAVPDEQRRTSVFSYVHIEHLSLRFREKSPRHQEVVFAPDVCMQ